MKNRNLMNEDHVYILLSELLTIHNRLLVNILPVEQVKCTQSWRDQPSSSEKEAKMPRLDTTRCIIYLARTSSINQK